MESRAGIRRGDSISGREGPSGPFYSSLGSYERMTELCLAFKKILGAGIQAKRSPVDEDQNWAQLVGG